MAGAVLTGADGGLLRTDVVRPVRSASMLGFVGDKVATDKEIDEGWQGGVYEFFCTVLIGSEIMEISSLPEPL
jgi:hypothetical protein